MPARQRHAGSGAWRTAFVPRRPRSGRSDILGRSRGDNGGRGHTAACERKSYGGRQRKSSTGRIAHQGERKSSDTRDPKTLARPEFLLEQKSEMRSVLSSTLTPERTNNKPKNWLCYQKALLFERPRESSPQYAVQILCSRIRKKMG